MKAEIGESVRQGGSCIILDTEYRDGPLVKGLPGARYDTDIHRWTTPLTWASCKTMRGMFADRLDIGDKLAAWSWDEYEHRIKPALVARELTEAPGAPELYPFQRAGVEFLVAARKALLCDSMGTGKTVQVIRTLKELYEKGENPFPVIVVCPNTVKRTWLKEFERWWPEIPVTILGGSAKKRVEQIAGATHVLVTNWELLRYHSRLAPYGSIRLRRCYICDPTLREDDKAGNPKLCEHCRKELNLREWRTIVADEAHKMKEPAAKQTRATWALATRATEFRFCLTGTPIASNPIDLWPALHLIDIWGTQSRGDSTRGKYIDRYCLVSTNPWSGGVTVVGLRPEHREEFFGVIDPNMRRMPKEAVLPFLPPKTYSTRFVEMTPKQKKAYEQMSDQLVTQLDSGILVAANPLVQLTRLVQFASAFAELNADGQLRLDYPSCKVDALEEVLEDMAGEPAVVFAQSRQLIELAGKRLEDKHIPIGYITGAVDGPTRQLAIDNFQAGRIRVILCTVGAGGIGITLTRANTAIFLQRSWSMIENRQAEDRVHRIGSEIHDKVNIVDIVSVDTIEEHQREVLNDKDEQLEEIVRDRQFLLKMLGK